MPLSPLIAKVYTPYATFVHRIAGLPLKARSLLIKQCQAQYDVIEPITTPTPTLIRLLNSHPDVVVTDLCDGRPMTLALRNFFSFYNVSVSDPLSSAIILDILRGVEVQHNDYLEAISSGWLKEIRLCLSEATPRCDFRSFFHDVDRPIHPSLPYNPSSTKRIRSIFRRFREMLILQPIMLYPRATHKTCLGVRVVPSKVILGKVRLMGSPFLARMIGNAYTTNLAVDPIRLWCIYYTGSRAFHVRERVQFNVWAFREVGDVAKCNSNRRLVLLERLGFVEKESISIQLDGLDAADFMYNLFVNPRFLPPEVYSYRVVRDIPDYFMYEDF